MAEGAIISAPASAWLTAIFARIFSVASLFTLPSLLAMPQCPVRLYWQMQTSVATPIALPKDDLISFIASWTMPFLSKADEPIGSLLFGMPKIIIDEMPLSAIDWTYCEILRIGVMAIPGIDFIRQGLLETNTGNTR